MQSLLHGSVSIFATKLNQSPAIGIQTEATPSIEIHIMKQGQTDITSQQDKNLDMVDEHMQLLDTIQEMVKTEVNKRIGESIRTEEKKDPHPENPPPRKQRARHTFWQYARNFILELF